MADRNARALEEQLLALPPGDRFRLAELLLASVQETAVDAESAWDREIQRRVSDLDSAKVQAIPAEEVFVEVERLLRR